MSLTAPADEMGPPSSQELPAMNSSPPRPPTYGPNGTKERRDPSVTPRKFRRFFTPRSHGAFQSNSRQALYDITTPTVNRPVAQSSPVRPFRSASVPESSPGGFSRELKRRKTTHTPNSSPESNPKRQSSLGLYDGSSTMDNLVSSPCERAAPNMEYPDEEGEDTEVEEEGIPREPSKRIVRLSERGLAGQLLDREIYASGYQRYEYPVNDWQDHTSRFYSRPEDVHMSMSIDGNERTIPFCAKGLNTNTLVAVGDEEGRVRLLESAKGGKPAFQTSHVAFRVHTNAIIDIAFSEDDTLLATASGDQSARVVDMSTQTTISILGNHTASLKQVRFQPGANNNSVLATSSRDGSIQIWDLRVNGYEGPSHTIFAPVESGRPHTRSMEVQYGRCINAIQNAHKPQSRQTPAIHPTDTPSRGEVAGRIGDVSVTAIQFLGAGLEHLILSASEADSSIKLWDIRSLATKRKCQIPLSYAQQPQSHSKWRHFGISSLNMSSDGSRLYSLCKDNTVYAYSTAHLMLGQAPELSTTNTLRPAQRPTQDGLGPLYGFRHPQLHATSFYVKSAIRRPKDGKCEMLAVGSSDGCAILFPTDERYFPKSQTPSSEEASMNFSSSSLYVHSGLRRVGSGLSLRLDDSVPISTNGTPLKRGHDREVGSLTWTSEGELVTVGDDYLVRCWREGDDEARDLRIGGEGEGRRWGCGWADVSEGFDDDEC